MYPDQQTSSNLRQAQDVADKTAACEAQTPQQVVGLVSKQAYDGNEACGVRERTLMERLQFEADMGREQAQRSRRAISILRDHPEFEVLLWLIRSGLV